MSDANAQYAIDIAAQMSGGAQTTAQIDALNKQLVGAGVTSDDLHDAIAKLSNAFTGAQAASKLAAEALSEGESQYSKLEKAALQASKAEEKAAQLGVVPPDVASKAAAATAAVNAYAQVLKGLEGEATKTEAAEKALGTQLANAKTLNAGAGAALEEHEVSARSLGRALGELGGPLGDIGRKVLLPVQGFQKLTDEFGSSNAAAVVAAVGMAALVVAIFAVAAAAVYGVAKVAEWSVGLADTARSVALTQEAFEVLNPTIEKFNGEIDELTTQTGLTEQAIDKIAQSLQEAHVSAANMPAALKAASLAEAALGSGGAEEFIKRMQASKQSVQAFSATVSDQLGGVVAKKLLGLDAQGVQFHKNIATLFGGLDIDPVLEGLQKLDALFDENTAAGQTIKFLFTSIFQPLIDHAQQAADVIEAFVLGFLIGALKIYLALRPAVNAVSSFLGFKDASLTNTLEDVKDVAEVVAGAIAVMAVVFGVVLVAVGATIAVFVGLQLAVYAVVAAVIYAGVEVVSAIVGAWNYVTGYLKSIDLSTIGHDLLQGLINGIEGGAAAFVKSITGVVGAGIDAAKHALGIHSPSTVFAEIGTNTVAGFTGAVDAGADDAQSSIAQMTSPEAAQASAGGAKSASSGNTAPAGAARGGFNFQGATFNFNGVKDGDDAESRFGEMLTRFLEGDAIQVGAEPAPA
jgi:hypothetical protein